MEVYGYKTVLKRATYEIVEKKSRFIAAVSPVSTEEEAQAFIASVKKGHRDARHNVFAYITGPDGGTKRYSDDGEPSGTAGAPILDVIAGQGFTNTIVVVTRYFGGVLLGTGGLTRAYGRAAREAVIAAGAAEMTLCRTLYIVADYGLSDKVRRTALQNGCTVADTQYTDSVRFTLTVMAGETEGFVALLNELTGGRLLIEIGETIYSNRKKDSEI